MSAVLLTLIPVLAWCDTHPSESKPSFGPRSMARGTEHRKKLKHLLVVISELSKRKVEIGFNLKLFSHHNDVVRGVPQTFS